jgi:hypothetical protein
MVARSGSTVRVATPEMFFTAALSVAAQEALEVGAELSGQPVRG